MMELQDVVFLKEKIEEKQQDIVEYRHLIFNISSVSMNERIKSTQDPDKMGQMFCKLDKMEEELAGLIKEYENMETEILKKISHIKRLNYRQILIKKYLEYKSMKNISEELKMTVRGCKKAHKKALELYKTQNIV